MDITLIYTVLGFGLAAYSVVANDSVQTLGTFIASNQRFKWYWLATAASAVLSFTLIYGGQLMMVILLLVDLIKFHIKLFNGIMLLHLLF